MTSERKSRKTQQNAGGEEEQVERLGWGDCELEELVSRSLSKFPTKAINFCLE